MPAGAFEKKNHWASDLQLREGRH